MADREPPYDPYIPSGSGNPGQNGGNQRTAVLQAVSRPGTLFTVMDSLLGGCDCFSYLRPCSPWDGYTSGLVERECDRVHVQQVLFSNEIVLTSGSFTAN